MPEETAVADCCQRFSFARFPTLLRHQVLREFAHHFKCFPKLHLVKNVFPKKNSEGKSPVLWCRICGKPVSVETAICVGGNAGVHRSSLSAQDVTLVMPARESLP